MREFVALLSVVAAIITVFVFFTGVPSLPSILDGDDLGPTRGAPPASLGQSKPGMPGVVKDPRSGLVWLAESAGLASWGEAQTFCEGLDLPGRTKWRLPTVRELAVGIVLAQSYSGKVWTSEPGEAAVWLVVDGRKEIIGGTFHFESADILCVHGFNPSG